MSLHRRVPVRIPPRSDGVRSLAGRGWRFTRRASLGILVAALTLVGTPAGSGAASEHYVIGRSREGRALEVWRLGDPLAARRAVVVAGIHGDEPSPVALVRALRDGPPITGLDLWVVPAANPDGLARHRRQNARGIDLNRNFPARWARLTGPFRSGRRPGSEPETDALMRLVVRLRPEAVVSIHQPLGGVDAADGISAPLAARLASTLRMRFERYDCQNPTGCHGTFAQWVTERMGIASVTIELGPHPSRAMLTERGPRGIVVALGGRVGAG